MTTALTDMSKEQLVTALVDLFDEGAVSRINSIHYYRGWTREALRRQIDARRAYLAATQLSPLLAPPSRSDVRTAVQEVLAEEFPDLLVREVGRISNRVLEVLDERFN
jgi:hypothetical protein